MAHLEELSRLEHDLRESVLLLARMATDSGMRTELDTAIARDLQARTGWSIKKIIRALRPLQHVTIRIAGQPIHAEPPIPHATAEMLKGLGH